MHYDDVAYKMTREKGVEQSTMMKMYASSWWNRCACSTLWFYAVLNRAKKIYERLNTILYPGFHPLSG